MGFVRDRPEGDANVMDRTGSTAAVGERLAGRLFDLAEQVRRLDPPGCCDPEAFGRDKSELAAQIAELGNDAARRLG